MPKAANEFVWAQSTDWHHGFKGLAFLRDTEEPPLDPSDGERRSDVYAGWSNGFGERAGDEEATCVGRRSSDRPGLQRPDASGSRFRQVSRAVRSRQHQAQELPGVHPRVDPEGA